MTRLASAAPTRRELALAGATASGHVVYR